MRKINYWFLPLFIIIFLMCGFPNYAPDPVSVQIMYSSEQGYLYGWVVYNGEMYTEANWPSNFTPPIFLWEERDPQSDANYRVGYSTIRRSEEGENLWSFAHNDSEGCYYYYAHVSFNDGSQLLQGQSPLGKLLFRVNNNTTYSASQCHVASGYIRVPYILGIKQDLNGDECGKTIDDGYRGNDCAGLAWYSGYSGDTSVGYTDCWVLDRNYGTGLPVDSLKYIMPPNSNTGYLDGCMIFVNVEGHLHVGIILNQDVDYNHQVIHCTASSQVEPRYEHGRMAMREDLVNRTYWVDNFFDIGRESTKRTK